MLEEILGMAQELTWIDWLILIPTCIACAIFGAFFTHIGDKKPFDHWLIVDEEVPKRIRQNPDGSLEVKEWKTRKKILDWGSWYIVARGVIGGTLAAVGGGIIFGTILELVGLGLDLATWIVAFIMGVFLKAVWDWKDKTEQTLLDQIKQAKKLQKTEQSQIDKILKEEAEREITDKEKEDLLTRIKEDAKPPEAPPAPEPTAIDEAKAKLVDALDKKVAAEADKIIENLKVEETPAEPPEETVTIQDKMEEPTETIITEIATEKTEEVKEELLENKPEEPKTEPLERPNERTV